MIKTHHTIIVFLLSCCFFISFPGCVSPGNRTDILALVDNEAITSEDLKYSLEIEHRRQDLSSAKTLDLSHYIHKLINRRLLVQEAYRNNLNKDPEIQEKVRDFTVREAVARLYNDEILQKVHVSEEEIQDYYNTNYEQLTLRILEAESEQEAQELFDRIMGGADFKELSLSHPPGFSVNNEGETILTRKALQKDFAEIIDSLKPGEISEIVQVHGKFYIIQLVRRQKSPEDRLDTERPVIERAIRKQKIDDRSAEYLQRLREQAPVKIDTELLSSMNLEEEKERERWLHDERILVKVYDSKLTAGQFTAMVPKSITKPEEKHLRGWINIKLVDHTALNRHYERDPAFRKKITRYRNELMMRAFFDKIVYPQVDVTDEKLSKYYRENRQDFLKPVRYKIQQITLRNRDEAERSHKSLQEGAQFSWLARQKSSDKYAQSGGARGWVFQTQLPAPVREVIGNLRPGEISSILKTDNGFVIIRLLEKTAEEMEDFDRIKDEVARAYISQEISNLQEEYLSTLKKDARITIFDDAVQAFERNFSLQDG